MERYGGADKSAECRGTVSTLFCASTRSRPQGWFTSGEDARLETGLLIRRAGCGKAASPDLWGRRRATAASTRPLGTPPIRRVRQPESTDVDSPNKYVEP